MKAYGESKIFQNERISDFNDKKFKLKMNLVL